MIHGKSDEKWEVPSIGLRWQLLLKISQEVGSI